MKKIHPSIKPEQPGRPTKRTDETLRILFEAAATGAPVKSCCAVAGIHPDTWQEWRESDPDLRARFDESRERGRVAALAALQKAAGEDWRAAAEWLRLGTPGRIQRQSGNHDRSRGRHAGYCNHPCGASGHADRIQRVSAVNRITGKETTRRI